MSDENRITLTLPLTEGLLVAIDNWRRLQPDIPDREAAAVLLLEAALEEAAVAAAQTPDQP